MKTAKKPTIGVAAIVKNEAYIVGDALLKCRQFFDEFFVLDTGSDDGTQDILKKHGVNWEQGSWADDFAKSRNQAIAHIKSDWVLMMDADEICTEQDAKELYKFLQNADKDAYWIRQCNSARGTFSRQASGAVPRLLRNGSGIKYARPLTESFVNSAGEMLKSVVAPFGVSHWGCLSELDKNPQLKALKIERNKRIMSHWLKENPADAVGWTMLAHTSLKEHDYESAYRSYDRGLQCSKNRREQLSLLEHICMCLEQLKYTDELFGACQMLQAIEAGNAVAHYYLCILAAAQGLKDPAIEGLRLLLKVPVPDRTPYGTLHHIFTRNRYLVLGKLLEEAGCTDEASAVYNQGAQSFGDAFKRELAHHRTEGVPVR